MRWSAIPNITRSAARFSSAARRSRPRTARRSLVKGNGMAEAKKLLAESGYDGTPVVIMAPGDVVTLKAQPIVAAQLLREAGFKVDVQATDWQTVVDPPRQPEAAEGGRLEHVLHQLGRRRRGESRSPTSRSAAAARMAAGSAGRKTPRSKQLQDAVRALVVTGGAEEDRRRHPEGKPMSR